MALDPGWAAVIGAGVGGITGVLGTIGGSLLTHWLNNRRASRFAKTRKERLKQLLSAEQYTWRSLDLLAAAIGGDQSTTTELLVEIEARPSLDGSPKWALVERAPWPKEEQSGK